MFFLCKVLKCFIEKGCGWIRVDILVYYSIINIEIYV